MSMDVRTYAGLLSMRDLDEAMDILFLSSVDKPFAEELQWMVGKNVTVRYWITDKQCSKEEAQEDFLRELVGAADGQYGSHYSEITGYLWTDEELNVGGHDLIAELKSHIGSWLILEIEVGW